MSSSTVDSSGSGVTSRSDELDVFYFVGSSISLFASLFVIFSYLKFPACRKHPSSLIFWRSFCDVIFSLQFIILFSNSSIRNRCDAFSFLFQFSILGSQSWYFTSAIDLFRAMRNPFTDPAANLPMYHLYVWTSSIASGVAIVAGGQAGYRDGLQICWTKVSNGSGGVNYLNWITFYIPTFLYYSCSIIVTIYAVRRLRSGLEETFSVRLKVLQNGVRYVVGFASYWTLAFIIYLLVWINERDGQANPDDHLPLYATFAMTIAVRALVDVPIWVYNQDVIEVYRAWWNKNKTSTETKKKENVDINSALRKEVLMFTTLGISNSIDNVAKMNALPLEQDPSSQYFPINLDPRDPSNRESIFTFMVNRSDVLGTSATAILATSLVGATTTTASPSFNNSSSSFSPDTAANTSLAPTASTPATVAAPAAAAPNKNNNVLRIPFVDYAPLVFHYIRRKFNIDDQDYKQSIKGETEKMIEKFTEGRSGSFFYFSEDGKYIVKTLTTGESKFLVHFLPHYIKYMSNNPHSLISRFIGFHSMTMYNLTIYFIVMQSVFLTPRKIHERYDLKGSWVDRNAGKTGRSSSSTAAGGKKKQGNPNKGIVLKDSDLNRTIRIAPTDRERFVHQVKADSEFLRDCNIMDYSLLLGIHHTRHFVRPINQLAAIAMRREFIPLTGESETLSRSAAGTILHTTHSPHHQKSQPLPVPTPSSPTASAPAPLSTSPTAVHDTTSSTSASAAALALGTPNGTGFGYGGFTNLNNIQQQQQQGGGVGDHTTTSHNSINSASSLSVMNSYSSYSTASIESFQRDDGGLQAAIIEGPGIYFFGIIDILQEYNSGKKLERFFKVYCRLKDPEGISALPPDPYSKRFVKAMIDMVTDDDDEEKIKEEAERNEEKDRDRENHKQHKQGQGQGQGHEGGGGAGDVDSPSKTSFGRISSTPLPSTSSSSSSHAHTHVMSSRASAPPHNNHPTHDGAANNNNNNATSPRSASTTSHTNHTGSIIVTNEPFRPNPLLASLSNSASATSTTTPTTTTTTTTTAGAGAGSRVASSSIDGPRGVVFVGQIGGGSSGGGPIAGRNANEVEPVPYDIFTRPSISNDNHNNSNNTALSSPPPLIAPPPPVSPASPTSARNNTTSASTTSSNTNSSHTSGQSFYSSSIVESSSTLASSSAASMPVASSGHLTQSVVVTNASINLDSSDNDDLLHNNNNSNNHNHTSNKHTSSGSKSNNNFIHSFSVTDSTHETKAAMSTSNNNNNNGWSSV